MNEITLYLNGIECIVGSNIIPEMKKYTGKTKTILPGHTPSAKDCPVFMTLSLIANKWSISILHQLMQAEKRTLRFSALKRSLGNITQRELTKHLRQFEETGIVERIVYPESPPRVEYMLTQLGYSLNDPISALSLWAEKNSSKIQQKRTEFDAKRTG